MNSNVNYGLWGDYDVSIWGVINYNKYIPLMRDFGNVGTYACVGAGTLWEIFVPFSQFFCESQTSF